MIHERKHAQWLRLGLLVAILMGIALLPSAPAVTQAQGGGSISYGAKVFGTIAADAPRVTYSFPGTGGDVITAIADNWTGALDLRAELIAPNGLIIASSAQNTLDDNMQGAYLSAVLPGDGIYLLWITSENETTGDFALTLLGRSAPDSTELVFGEAVDVTLLPAADPLLFWFEAERCPTSLVVTNLSEGQPFTYPFALKVHDQRGQTVALLRGGEELEDWVTVTPLSGRYEVEVSSDHLLEAGNVRLLVTCSADVPGCPAGQAGLSGVAGTGPGECPSCFVPGDPPGGGGCPDLNFRAEVFPLEDARRVTVTWEAMAGATGYTVTVYGRTADSGEMYLTHATWTPGDPTSFTWFLPEHYVAFRFLLRVAIGDDVVCVAETSLEFEVPPDGGEPVCETFSIDVDITSLEWREVTWTWPAYPGAEAYVLEWFEVLDDGSEALRGSILLAPGTTGFTVRLPAPTGAADTWRLRVRVQLDGGFPCFAESTFGFLHHEPDCEDFILVETVHTPTSSTIIWSEYPGALGYMLSLLDETGETMIPPFPLLLPPDQLSYVLEGLPPGTYLVRVGPWMEATFCEQELALTFEQGQFPCLIRTNRADVRVRVGPGLDRAAFAFLTAGVEYPVIGHAFDAAGNRWWQLDRTAIPGGMAALSLWVLDSEVEEIGDCDNVPQGEVPPVIPAEPEVPPGEPGRPPGEGWGPCGSCDTCGHPASECVLSPEGACLWDPATCGAVPGGQCFMISATVDMSGCQYTSGSASIVTAPNCAGGHSPGTTITASASADDPKCNVDYWSGCGASGGDNSVTFTATGSCTVTAHMHYGP
jgi:hypothetical protein